MKKRTKLQNFFLYILPPAVTLFLIVLFISIWEFIAENSKIILLITGGIILLSILVGVFKWKKFIKGVKSKF
jgi:hypothetical protein